MVTKSLELPPGRRVIHFECTAESFREPSRTLVFAVHNHTLKEIHSQTEKERGLAREETASFLADLVDQARAAATCATTSPGLVHCTALPYVRDLHPWYRWPLSVLN